MNADHEKLQFEWCCKSKKTSGIPYCPDIGEGNSDNIGQDELDYLDELDDNPIGNQYHLNGLESRNNLHHQHHTSHDQVCPTHGCPKENIKYYWHGEGSTPCTLNEQ